MSEPTPLEAIFFAALEKPAAERASYLEKACGGDADLRRRVERMLTAQVDAASFLETPPSAIAREANPTIEQTLLEKPGVQIGPYKLIEQIGEGGMGTVWMAQQTEPVKRLVALKLIKAGMDSAPVIARFEAERQALALMDHANIARVLDAGTTAAGRPYFVMDLVKGMPITRYCDEHHLTPRQRLELFIPVCQAVQHAHQKGIIHRDLKPSNVLVALYDGKPVPKVIDFGVAKATGQSLTDKTLVTGFGNIVGTLEYMSPEQAEINQLDIDTRSDIYSLGVLLYELLAGSTPFSRKELEQAGMLEMLRVIREQEPSKPSIKLSSSAALPTLSANRGTEPAKLTRLVRGELDWIVMKALEKDRSRRYETANGFAMDVQRYLADEPVQACPPSAAYRLRKFVRRNKGPVLAGSLVVVVLVAGIIGTTWGMLRATEEEANAKREAGEKTVALRDKQAALTTATANEIKAKAAQKDAQENLKQALAAVDQMLVRVGNDRLRFVPQMEAIRRDLVQDAVKFYQRFLEKNADDPLIRKETALAYRRLADLHRILGQSEESEDAFRKAFALFEQLEAKAPLEPNTRDDLIAANIEFAGILRVQGKRAEQQQRIRLAVQIAEELVKEFPQANYGDALVDANMHLAGVCPPDEGERILRRNLTLAKQPWVLANNYCVLGVLLANQDRYKEAEEVTAQAIPLREQVAAQESDRNWPQYYLGEALGELAAWMEANGRLPEAAETNGRATAVLDKVAADFPGIHEFRSSQARTHHRLAGVRKKLDQTAEAEKSYRRAVNLFGKMAADFPAMPEYCQTTFDQHLNLGQFLKETGKPQEAIRAYQDASSIASKLPTDDHNHFAHWTALARTQIDLGRLLAATGKNQDAEAAYRGALAVRDRLEEEFAQRAEFQRDLAVSYLPIGEALSLIGQKDESIKTLQMALAHAQKWVAAEPRGRDSRTVLAQLYIHLGVESEKAARQAIALSDELAAEFPQDNEYGRRSADAHYRLGGLLQGREAEKEIRTALEIMEKIELDPREEVGHCGHCRRTLAFCVWDAGNTQEAEELFGRALNDFEKLSAAHPDLASYRHFLADTHRLIGQLLALRKQFPEAEKAYRRSIEIHEQRLARSSDQTPVQALEEDLDGVAASYLYLGALLMATGREQEAESVFQRAAEIYVAGLKSPRTDVAAWYNYALVRLQLGQKQDYQQACTQMLERYGQSASANDAFWTSWTCVLAPDAVADWTKPLQLAEQADYGKNKINHVGAVLFRAGRFEEALQRLTEAEAEAKETPNITTTIVYNWLFQAMAHQRLGHTAEAASWLKKAVQAIDEASPESARYRRSTTWHRRLTLQLLRREAEKLLKKE